MPSLADLPFIPYLDESGDVPADFVGKIGVYAIFNADRLLKYVGISRDIASSLRLHMVRVPTQCHWVKVATVEKPNRTALMEIQTAWLAGQTLDPGEQEQWEQPLQCQQFMTDEEKYQLAQATIEIEQEKVLKNVARRIEKSILAQLADRGVKFDVRFNPKLKSAGILDVK